MFTQAELQSTRGFCLNIAFVPIEKALSVKHPTPNVLTLPIPPTHTHTELEQSVKLQKVGQKKSAWMKKQPMLDSLISNKSTNFVHLKKNKTLSTEQNQSAPMSRWMSPGIRERG